MTVAAHHPLIEVQALKVGMFVLLDGGWMSHPFPLSRFRIGSAEQIDTLRSLGLRQVRWDPGQSVLPAPAAAGAASTVRALAAEPPAAPVAELPPLTPKQAALARQTESMQQCERQFAEAGHELRLATGLVGRRPREARVQAEALSGALVGKMIGAQALCVQLLGEQAGDKASLHAMNVTVIALLLGRSCGLAEGEMQDLGVGAMLHDIGKSELPERLRLADERFTASERRVYEEHVAHGLAHARRMGLAAGAMQVIAQHHEHADGSGFPHGLGTDAMSAAARIVALVNRYDKLCNPKFPAHASTPHEALALLFAQDRTRVDSAMLNAFVRMLGVYPPGSTVQLTDERYAMVMSVNTARPLRPDVLVFDATVPREEALLLALETQPGLGIRRSLRPPQLPPQVLAYLSPRQRVAYFFEPARDAGPAA